MVKRIQLRIMVDLQDGLSKQALLVYRNENAALAARRFAIQHGVSAMGQKNLEAHILAQVKESTLLYALSHTAPHTNPRINKSGEA